MPVRKGITGRSQDARERFFEEVRHLIKHKGDNASSLAAVLGWERSYLHKIFSGTTLGGPEVAQALDSHYRTTHMLPLWELAQDSEFREQYREYMKYESEAVSLWHHGSCLVPGLLQTGPYARYVLMAGGFTGVELETQVNARLGRRALLRGGHSPRFRTILSEAVLRSPLPDNNEWRDQLEFLIQAADQENVVVQVALLATGPHRLTGVDVMFLRLPGGGTQAWIENGYRGDLLQDASEIQRLHLGYDRLRDQALSPDASRELIRKVLEEVPCGPST